MNIQRVFLIFLILPNISFAARVILFKNQSAVIQSTDEKLEAGQIYFIYDENISKTGTIQLTTVKNNRAVGKVIEGTVNAGQTARLQEPHQVVFKKNKFELGLSIQYLNNALTVVEKSAVVSESVALTGNNFALSFFFDYKINDSFSAKTILGYEIYDLKGTSVNSLCENALSANCFVKSNYLTVGEHIQFYVSEFWLALGGTVKYSLSKSSNALFLDDIKLKSSVDIAIGKNFDLNQVHFIPVSLGYQHSLNISDEAPKNSQIYLSVGYGRGF